MGLWRFEQFHLSSDCFTARDFEFMIYPDAIINAAQLHRSCLNVVALIADTARDDQDIAINQNKLGGLFLTDLLS